MSNCGFRDGVVHMHSERCHEAGRREVVERLAAPDLIEALGATLMAHTDETCPARDCGEGFGYHDVDTREERSRGCQHLAVVALAAVRAALDGDR